MSELGTYDWPTSPDDIPGEVCCICGEPRSHEMHNPGHVGARPHPYIGGGSADISATRLRLDPGDILVVTVPLTLGRERISELSKVVAREFPDNQAVLVREGIELSNGGKVEEIAE